MGIKKYYSLETVLEALEVSKDKFLKKPFLSQGEDGDEIQLIIESFLGTLMKEIIVSESEYLDLKKLQQEPEEEAPAKEEK